MVSQRLAFFFFSLRHVPCPPPICLFASLKQLPPVPISLFFFCYKKHDPLLFSFFFFFFFSRQLRIETHFFYLLSPQNLSPLLRALTCGINPHSLFFPHRPKKGSPPEVLSFALDPPHRRIHGGKHFPPLLPPFSTLGFLETP